LGTQKHSLVEPIFMQAGQILSQAEQSVDKLDWSDILLVVYLVGIAVRVIMATISIRSTLGIMHKSIIQRRDNVTIYRTDACSPFSFFRYVFLPKNFDDPGVLAHEMAHVQQYHWLDLVIVESASIALWFNPVMRAYKQVLKQQHEYLADRAVVTSGLKLIDYLFSIKRQISFAVMNSLANGFYSSSIKNRINMLTKQSTPSYKFVYYSIALPLLVVLLTAFSPQREYAISEVTDSVKQQVSLGLPIEGMNDFSLISGFGQRIHPVLGGLRMHTGIDLRAKEGTPVVSTLDGVVLEAQFDGDWGNKIVIKHDDDYSTSYSHLKSIGVKAGDKVRKGVEIGQVGNTGMSTQSHLHFELLKAGQPIDSVPFFPKEK
jgi:murein DD-endopeptidase MepM/ murein hydrolase activator NlpD